MEPPGASPSANFDAPRQELGAFWNSNRQHSIFQAGVDTSGLEFVAQQEALAKNVGSNISVQRVQPWLRRDFDSAFNKQI